MRFTTISQITPTERPLPAFSCLLRMLSEISSPLEKSLVNIFYYRIFDNAEIHETTQTVSRLYFEIEQGWQDLRYNKIDFINSWATDHNDFFWKAKENLDEMSQYIMQIIGASGHIPYNHILSFNLGDVQDWVLPESSYRAKLIITSLNRNAIQSSLGDNSYPPEVKNLFSKITGFLRLYSQCHHFCQETLDEQLHLAFEDYGTGTVRLYNLFVKKAINTAKVATKYFSADKVEELKRTLRIYRDYEQSNSFKKFTSFGYHRYTPEEVSQFIMILCFEHENNIFTPTKEEISIFGNNGEKILQCRYIIRHFDELLPGGTKHDEFVLYVYALSKWANAKSVGKFTSFFSFLYNGDYVTPKISTVYSKSRIYEKDSKQIKNFFSAISNLLANREKAGLEVESV